MENFTKFYYLDLERSGNYKTEWEIESSEEDRLSYND